MPAAKKRGFGERRGTDHPNAAVDEDDVRMMRKLYSKNPTPETIKGLASVWNIGYATAARIVKIQSWWHVK